MDGTKNITRGLIHNNDDDEYMEILREMETTMDKLKVQTVKIVKNIYICIFTILL